ncbi:hypothetical protein B7R74_00850 [Yersinia pseudotuberculosis]|nr:hypothetical protein B7R74_00850 [Yersinia pseudotuberculosis]
MNTGSIYSLDERLFCEFYSFLCNLNPLSVDKNYIDGSLNNTRSETDIDHITMQYIPVGNLLFC